MEKKTFTISDASLTINQKSKRDFQPAKGIPAYEKIIKSLRKLVKIKTFEKITISEICKDAGISRKTFYDNFKDKNDIVERIILTNIIEPYISLSSMISTNEAGGTIMIEWLYEQFYQDREFFEKINFFTGQNSLQDFIIKHNTAIVMAAIQDINISEQEKEYMAYFYATSHASLLTKWIRDGMVVSPKEMASYYEKWTLSFWKNLYS